MEAILRRFARDQWVRLHGTPRVTVLVGGAHARALWQQWLELGALVGVFVDGAIETALPDAVARALAEPRVPIAVSCSETALRIWRSERGDRLAAMADEGAVVIPDPESPKRAKTMLIDARSAAETALFEALEATPATAGRFELNGYLSVRFGSNAAEVDLLSRGDRIAVEIDGYHHFTDADAYRRDRKKDLLLQTQGLFVIRVLATDIMQDPRPTVNMVCQAIAARLQGRKD